jgi:hypothetical protein
MSRRNSILLLLPLLTACNTPVAPPPVQYAQEPAHTAIVAPVTADRVAPDRPDPHLTPGAVLPVTAADLVPGYAGRVRNVPASEKRMVYEEYGITSHHAGEYEIDHLISLELGGSNDITNLWPENYTGTWNAHLKDRLENELHRRVVTGQMTLHDAQHAIATDWIATYCRVFPQDVQDGIPKPVGHQSNAQPDND